MRRLLPLLSALALACGSGGPPPPPADGGVDGGPPPVVKELSVATWNVQNFFDWIDDPDKSDTVPSASEYNTKRQGVGAILRLINADVVVLEEVENERVANDLKNQELSSLGYGPPVVSDGNDTRGINIVLFSRYPVRSVVSHKNDTFKSPATGKFFTFARDCLEVEIDVEGVIWTVFGVHFISQLADSDDRRLAEASHVRSLVDRRLSVDAAARVVVTGDFNDLPASPPLQALLGGGTTHLADTSTAVRIDLRYTYVFNGSNRQLDYVLASSGTNAAQVATSIFHDSAVGAVSDHRPVRATFPPP